MMRERYESDMAIKLHPHANEMRREIYPAFKGIYLSLRISLLLEKEKTDNEGSSFLFGVHRWSRRRG